jgi:hypothetical protein
MALTYYPGDEVTAFHLAPTGANAVVIAQIEEIIAGVRATCPDNEFVALQRKDKGWIFVPTVGTARDKNLCTVWIETDRVDFDVRSQQPLDGVGKRRSYPDAVGPNLLDRLRVRYAKMLVDWRKRNPE